MANKVPVSFRMEPGILDWLKKHKKATGVPLTFIVEQAVREYRRRHRRRKR